MGKGQETTRMVELMTKFKIPDYYNQSKPTPDEEEILIERKCYIYGTKANMGRFERYCSANCRSRATRLDSKNHNVRFR